MKLLMISHVRDTTYEVTGIHYKPFDEIHGLPQEVIDSGFLVEEVVDPPEYVFGKEAVHYFDSSTKEQWYEYVDRELTPEEQIVELKQQLVESEQAVLELSTIIGGMYNV